MLNTLTNGLTPTGRTVTLIVGVVLAALVVGLIVYRFHNSSQKDRWVDRIATVLVLAWTSEGMWELATRSMHLPKDFVIASFFVVESMMVASAMRANAHRNKYGVPGRSGYAVWGLAGLFGFIVALGTATSVAGFLLRLSLPLAATLLWWNGLTAERDTDTAEMKAARAKAAEEREGRWTITPRTLLVRVGLMKPGKISLTEAQRQLQIRRMVSARLRSYGTDRAARRAQRRLEDLGKTADDPMLFAVWAQVNRTVHVMESTDGYGPAPKGVGTPAKVIAETPLATPSDTPRRNPSETPAEPLAAPWATPPRVTPAPRVNGNGAGTPEPPVTSDGTADDTLLLADLRDPSRVSRNPDGTVPVKRAMKALGVGRNRAIRLLDTLNLRTVPDPDDDGTDTPGDTPGSKGSADDEERHPAPHPINGHDLVGALR